MRAGVGFGSNVGDRLASLSAARQQVTQLPGVKPPVLASAKNKSEPIDCEPGAARFFNAVIEIGYSGGGEQLLRDLRRIEESLGRPPDHPRNAPRTLDLDLLYFGLVVISTPELQLPHPRMHERRFVLAPLAEIRPDLVLPQRNGSVAALLQELPDRSPLLRVASEW
jgi:2-amino-4-hydroxy-6-hydroxymethyldihydropteridine diphosphokinase